MTTDSEPSDQDQDSKEMAESILKGDGAQAAEAARQFMSREGDVNDLLDTISDTMNIVADLHEVEKYSVEQVENCEDAAERALDMIRPKLRVEQTRISGRVMVTSMQGDPHSFDKTLLLAMLKIGGFTPLDGGIGLSPQQLAAKVEALKPDILAVAIVTPPAAQNLTVAKSLIDAAKSKAQIVAFGKSIGNISERAGLHAVEEDSLSALSRIAELLIAKPGLPSFSQKEP